MKTAVLEIPYTGAGLASLFSSSTLSVLVAGTPNCSGPRGEPLLLCRRAIGPALLFRIRGNTCLPETPGAWEFVKALL